VAGSGNKTDGMVNFKKDRTVVLLVSSIFLLLTELQTSSACICLLIRNFKCPALPTCCESGYYAMDECGCCQKCAKAELQTCGGASDVSGRCAKGLQCLKTCLPCKTVGESGSPCIFPFKYAGETYSKCTSRDSDNGQPWCATKVDSEGYVVDNAWGDCLEGCPGTRVECDDKYFSIQEGKCIDVTVPGAIPNWFGAPAVKLEESTAELFEAPLCSRRGAVQRFYDNTCRCVRGQTAVDFDLQGNPRGNCTGLEDNDQDNLDKVWCFLENIRDPLDPHSGCYSDTRWSERDARFWSALACTQSPDIETPVNRRPGEVKRPDTWPSHKPVQPPSNSIPRIKSQPRPGPTAAPVIITTAVLQEQPRSVAGEEEGEQSHRFSFSDEDLSEYYYSDYPDEEEETAETEEKVEKVKEEKEKKVGDIATGRQFPRTTELDIVQYTDSVPETTTSRRFRIRDRHPRIPHNADPRRRASSLQTTTNFPFFRRRPTQSQKPQRKQTRRQPRPRTTTTLPLFDYDYTGEITTTSLPNIEESPRSFLEDEFGENNIPLALPLFENGEFLDEIFKKIPTTTEPTTQQQTYVPLLVAVKTKNVEPTTFKTVIPIIEAEDKSDVNDYGVLPLSLDYELDVVLNTVDEEGQFKNIDEEKIRVKDELDVVLNAVDEEGQFKKSDEEKITVKNDLDVVLNSVDKEGEFKNSDEEKITVKDGIMQEVTSTIGSVEEWDSTTEISTIPNVFRHLPTLSTGRRDQSKWNAADTPKSKSAENVKITKPKNQTSRSDISTPTTNSPSLSTTITTQSKEAVDLDITSVTQSLLSTESTTSSSFETTEQEEKEIDNSSSTMVTEGAVGTRSTPSTEVMNPTLTLSPDPEVVIKQTIVNSGVQQAKGSQVDNLHSQLRTELVTDKADTAETTIPPQNTTPEIKLYIKQNKEVTKKKKKTSVRNKLKSKQSQDLGLSAELTKIVNLGLQGLWSSEPRVPRATSPMPVFRRNIRENKFN